MKALDYQPLGEIEAEITGSRAKGFRYSYQGVERMQAEVLVTKHGKMHYTLHFFAPDTDTDALAVFDAMLRTVQF